MGIPYTYRVTHLPSGKHYYGARYAKDCHPSDLWVKYFTSSSIIKDLIVKDGKDAFFVEIRKVFSTVGACCDWERKVLTRLRVSHNENWLNLVVSHLPTDEEQKRIYVERFGTATPQFLPKVDAKRKRTCLAKYGTERPQSSEIVKNKTKNTNIERYGVGSTLSLEEVQEKIKQTRRERYGSDHHFSNEEIKQKISETNMKRYGISNVLGDPLFREKAKVTNLMRYGVEHPTQSDEIKAKIKTTISEKYPDGSDAKAAIYAKAATTSIERYGVKSYLATDECKSKTRETSLVKYGCERPCQNKDIIERIEISKRSKMPIICSVCGLPVNDFSAYSQFHGTKCKWKPIECTDTGQVFSKRTELMIFVRASSPKANYQAIRNVCDGKHQTAYGYHWRYATESDLDQSTNKDV